MTISLTIGRNAFKICHKEGSRTTVWDVHAEDGEEKLIQTFRDVIAFVESSPTHTAFSALAQAAGIPAAALRREPEPPIQTGNGWAAMAAPPEIPEGADYELIPPGEEA